MIKEELAGNMGDKATGRGGRQRRQAEEAGRGGRQRRL
jgi:hypothetical protein